MSNDWKHLNPQTWTPQHVAFIKTAAEQPEVERVLVNAAIKKELCRVEDKAHDSWMAKVRPWYGHHDHIHVRLKCPADSPNCRAQPPVPGGDGCGAKELDYWFSDKVIHPKIGPAWQTTKTGDARRFAARLQNRARSARQEHQSGQRQALTIQGERRTPMSKSPTNARSMDADTLQVLGALERKVLWLASWTIHNANHLRENADGLKVGGHQASSASLATIMTALYFDVLRTQDRVAVKPHASPIFHAIQYLLGKQTRERLEAFRGYKGAQSYPSRTKDTDDVDFSTGSVGLGVAQTLFSSLTQDYVRAHGWGLDRPEGRMVALVGDAELDEGNIFEALLEGWKQGLRNCWWIIDYNRQSLDAVVREGLWERYEQLFTNFGWDVVILKYGSLQQAAFKEPGGERLRQWIDSCPNQLYSALVFAGGAAWRKRLNDEIGDQGEVSKLIERRNDDELAALMNNLGGHDLPSILEAFHNADPDKPTCFICYTIKGFGLPFAGHKDNHAGLMTPAQMETFRQVMGVRPGHEWDKFEGLSLAAERLQSFLDRVPFAASGARRLKAPADRRAGPNCGHHPAGDVDADRLRRAFSTRSAATTATSHAASSPHRPT